MDGTTYISSYTDSGERIDAEGFCRCDVFDWATCLWHTEVVEPGSTIAALTNMLDAQTQRNLAESPLATSRALATLAFSEWTEVRAAVTDNPHTAYWTLVQLAHDESADVRFQLAENHNIQDDILKLLSEDDNPYVAWRAQLTLGRRAKEEQRQAA